MSELEKKAEEYAQRIMSDEYCVRGGAEKLVAGIEAKLAFRAGYDQGRKKALEWVLNQLRDTGIPMHTDFFKIIQEELDK